MIRDKTDARKYRFNSIFTYTKEQLKLNFLYLQNEF